MADKQKLTKAGYKKLQDELKYLVDVAREEIKVQLAEARAQGDLSENADYDFCLFCSSSVVVSVFR